VRTHKIKGDESLIEVARRFGIGYNAIVDANPGVDPFIPEKDRTINIPTSWILPDIKPYEGIVINLSEMRMYFFSKHSGAIVRTYPIGIGSEGNETPLGIFTITEKMVKPSWRVPESIRKERPELPPVVPPGPDNPLGSHALRLSAKSVLIHGTNRPFAVGRKASHGCIRMYPEDIPKLFQAVANKTKVTIIRQPVKVGASKNRVFIEIHKDEYLQTNYFNEAVQLLRKKNLYENIDKDKMLAALKEKKGIPIDITKSTKNEGLVDY
jgi:L,D-transpeptidase ErfK/SrfK